MLSINVNCQILYKLADKKYKEFKSDHFIPTYKFIYKKLHSHINIREKLYKILKYLAISYQLYLYQYNWRKNM